MEVLTRRRGLSLLFSTFCIIDLFGVFPIITLPKPIADCGWIGLPLAFFVFSLQIYTALLLGRCWTMAEYLDPPIVLKSRCPYSAMTSMALGEKAGKMVTVVLDVAIFGAGIPNLIIASQNMQIIGLKLTEHQFNLSCCYWLLILGTVLCPVTWLGSPKDMKWLALLSVTTVMSVSVLTWTCMTMDEFPTSAGIPGPEWESTAVAIGIISFQFDIHPTVLSVQMDMEDKSQLGKSVLSGFIVTASLFTITSIMATRKYGNQIYFNILEGLPGSAALYFNLTLVTAQIFFSTAIGTSALFQDVEDKLGIPKEFNLKRCIVRSCFVILIVFLGECIPRLDLIMGLVGGMLMGPLMFVLPPLLYSKFRSILHNQKIRIELQKIQLIKRYEKSRKKCYDTFNERKMSKNQIKKEERKKVKMAIKLTKCCRQLLSFDSCLEGTPFTSFEKTACSIIVIFGIFATISATYFTIKNTLLYAKFTPSCLLNSTAASYLIDI